MIQGPIITDIVYNNFVFKYQGSIIDKMIYEVYPSKKIEPLDFINEIIYNDKTRFNLSLLLNMGISNIKGYITIDTEKSYKMIIELEFLEESVIADSFQSFETQTEVSDFYPLNIKDIQYPCSFKYYKIFNSMNIEHNYIDNIIYVASIDLVGLNPKVITADDIYDAIVIPLEERFNADINPTKLMKIDFDKVFYVTRVPVYENSFYDTTIDNWKEDDDEDDEFDGNLSVTEVIDYLATSKQSLDDKLPPIKHNMTMNIYFRINKINNLEINYVSSSKLIIEKNEKEILLPVDIVSYFYHPYCIYREGIHEVDIFNNTTGKSMSTYTFTNILCFFNKTKVQNTTNKKIIKFLKNVFKKDDIINIYKSSRPFSKLKYFGYIYDPETNFGNAIDAISKYEIFKKCNITLVNETQNYAFITLTNKENYNLREIIRNKIERIK